MVRRIAAALLWFYSAWTAWSFAVWALGVESMVGMLAGPLIGAVAAGLFAGDPRRIIWVRPVEAAGAATSRTSAPDPA